MLRAASAAAATAATPGPIRRLLQRGTTQMLPGTFGAGNSASTGNPGGGTTGSGTTGNSAFGTGSAGTFGGGSTDTTAWGTGTTGAFSGGSTMGGQTTGGSTISGQNTGTFGGGAIGSTTDAASGGSTTSGGGYPYIIATLKAAKRGDTKARNNLLALQVSWWAAQRCFFIQSNVGSKPLNEFTHCRDHGKLAQRPSVEMSLYCKPACNATDPGW